MHTMDVWYARLPEQELMAGIKDAARAMERAGSKKAGKTAQKTAEKQARKAHTRDSVQALSKLAEQVDGRYRIVSQPPVVVPVRDLAPRIGLSVDELEHVIHEQFRDYRETLQDDRRHLLEEFEVVDMAHKVVGVGSVGTRAFIVLLQGRDQDDPLFLQIKEATASVLEDHLPKSKYRHPGERVVKGQRMMQAASDIFLGWTKRHEGEPLLLLAPASRYEGFGPRREHGPGGAQLLRLDLRSNSGPRARPFRRSGGVGRVHGQEGSVRTIDHRLLRTLCRPERARLPGLRGRRPLRPARRPGERLERVIVTSTQTANLSHSVCRIGIAATRDVFDTRHHAVVDLDTAVPHKQIEEFAHG